AGTGIDVFHLLNGLKQNGPVHTSSLELLDLSHTTVKAEACAILGEVLGCTKRLSTLVLRGISLSKASITTVLSPWFHNAHLLSRAVSLNLDMSENDLSGLKVTILAELLLKSTAMHRDTLKLNHCGLRDASLEVLLSALSQCVSLRALHLDGNGGSTKTSLFQISAPALEMSPGDAFVKLLTKQRLLKQICLSNSSSKGHKFSLALLRPVLHSLSTYAATVEVLDISGNRGGDEIAKCLAFVLPKTHSLQALFWDRNGTTLEGFRQFKEGLCANRSLLVMPVPIEDTRRLLDRRGGTAEREELFSILGCLYEYIERNQMRAPTAQGSVASSLIIRDAVDVSKSMCKLPDDTTRQLLLECGSALDVRQSWSRDIHILATDDGDNNAPTRG
ncbi:hypothetical protein LEN26_008050, partial [Aphanomyces euteiches]